MIALCGLSAVNQLFSNIYRYGDLKLSNKYCKLSFHSQKKTYFISENNNFKLVSMMKNLEINELNFVIIPKL